MAASTTQYDPDARNATLHRILDLAHIFSNCVEAFGLIHPQHQWERNEQLLLTKLGIQQARLLVWGSIIGISSPPASIATHMIPTRPAPTNPNPEDAVFFGVRDDRLDDPANQTQIKDALTDIIDRSEHLSREQMMHEYGLKPSKRGLADAPQPVDSNRLASYREKFWLLLDLVEAHGITPPRSHSVVAHPWTIVNLSLFSSFVALIKTRIDTLIALFDLDAKVNRAVEIDIRALGWHPSFDLKLSARNTSKLMLITDACRVEYPGYARATQQALDNVNDRWKGIHGYDNLVLAAPVQEVAARPASPSKHKRPGILSFFRHKSWQKSTPAPTQTKTASGPTRSLSVSHEKTKPRDEEDDNGLEPVRSKSMSAFSDSGSMPSIQATLSQEQASQHDQLEKSHPLTLVTTMPDDNNPQDLSQIKTMSSMISRNDQWRPDFR